MQEQEHIIVVEQEPDPEKDDQISKQLQLYNQAYLGIAKKFSVYAYDTSGKLIGGVLCCSRDTTAYLEILWVQEDYRETGLGTKILLCAEQEVCKQGFRRILIDTFEFQAVNFYLKNGYTETARVKEYMDSCDRIFLKKDLIETVGEVRV